MLPVSLQASLTLFDTATLLSLLKQPDISFIVVLSDNDWDRVSMTSLGLLV